MTGPASTGCRRLSAALLAALWLLGTSAVAPATELQTASLPTDRLIRPSGDIAGLVVLLSDAAGWSPAEEAASQALAAEGALVIGVDLPSYYAALRRETRDCLYLIADVEKLSKEIHRLEGLQTYHPPLLAGWGEGASLALAMTAQSPQATISETVAVDPGAPVPLQTPLCTPAPKTPVPGGIVYGLTSGALPQPVSIAFSRQAGPEGRAQAAALKASHPDIVITDGAGAAADLVTDQLRAASLRHMKTAAPLDLPIVVLDAEPVYDTLAVIYSGDGGWRDIDQKLGAHLQEAGVPVVGVDALRYFWSEKSPEQTAADLTRILAVHKARWKVRKVVLVGYSFGANILPATYLRLPQADRQAITLLSLLALSHAADFEIALTGWVGIPGSAKHGDPVDHLNGIEPVKIQCIEGKDDPENACPALRPRLDEGVEIITRDGGHHFDGDYRALSAFILQRLGAPLP
ncbi:virulence factor family protein [Rhizobium sp. CG5]|uniref:AcvB/VirJ family lysyl-phosphatidylglycerol hydrolase n=1 Tax=Rhizobium sp. CG5 TaxID=2726076 RepID=UPI002033FB8A|nr:AcvB/VirJ family lysyl-phosphatidylglycerol hydrolase [Rhizobium sp. CG5]MCM2476573.1 virulence factor family protein [Rhizobium sp. CG5]